MSTEIINARRSPLEGSRSTYSQKKSNYIRSAKRDSQIKLFCEGYSIHGTITGAADHAGVDPNYHYQWLDTDPQYPEEFRMAHLRASEALVAEGRRRALQGVEEPTGWYRGEPGGFVRRYSDSLLQFLIKGAFPEIYKERHEHTGKNGGPIEVQSISIEQFPVWLKQAIVVVSSGVEIDPEVERVLMEHFEAKFFESIKMVEGKGNGNGSGNGSGNPQRGVIEIEGIVEESVATDAGAENEEESTWSSPAKDQSEPKDFRLAIRPDSAESQPNSQPRNQRIKKGLDLDEL